jgi:hypothetical protein
MSHIPGRPFAAMPSHEVTVLPQLTRSPQKIRLKAALLAVRLWQVPAWHVQLTVPVVPFSLHK